MKKLLVVVAFIITVASVNAQHSINLTNGNTIKGEITAINPSNIHIVGTDSLSVYDVEMKQILSYDAGEGTITVAPLISTPGDELIKASRMYFVGTIITAGGLIISTVGLLDNRENVNADKKKALVVAGISISMVGVLQNIIAFSHIAKAGQKFNATISSDGLGVSMKF
jgi:hypothetical protein